VGVQLKLALWSELVYTHQSLEHAEEDVQDGARAPRRFVGVCGRGRRGKEVEMGVVEEEDPHLLIPISEEASHGSPRTVEAMKKSSSASKLSARLQRVCLLALPSFQAMGFISLGCVDAAARRRAPEQVVRNITD
jgi:hypothetical protein